MMVGMPRLSSQTSRVPARPLAWTAAIVAIGLGSAGSVVSTAAAKTPRAIADAGVFDPATTDTVADSNAAASSDKIGFKRPALATPLRVAGNAVVDARGRALVLGGVHRSGYETATGDDLTSREADSLARWSSMVRIQVNASLLQDKCAYAGSQWRLRIDRAVAMLTRRNVVSLLDMHFSAPTSCASPGRIALPSRAEAVPFWRNIGARYAKNPMVAFELWNEPHDVSDRQWAQGGVLNDKATGRYQAEGMQGMYDAVRSVSSVNLIVVDGNDYAGSAKAIREGWLSVTRSRTVWAMHVYTCAKPNDQVCLAKPANRQFPVRDVARNGWDALAQSAPVIMTETGFPDSSDQTWMQTAAWWAKAHSPAIGIIGFATDGAWGGSPWAILIPKSDWAPNAAGQPLTDYMRTVAPATR